MSAAWLEHLVRSLPEGTVVTDPDVVAAYRSDRAATAPSGRPAAVVRARGVADVQTVMAVADEHRVPVVPRGAGTGLSGGSSGIEGGITLSTERMRRLEIDAAAGVAAVGPGVLNGELKAAAAARGLWYPPDPSSFEICSVGGNVATNAGGACCVKYGVTTDYVAGLEVVLAGGKVLRLGGRTVKDVAGYDLKRLFVGSEGTLGVIVGATLRLRPRPAPASTVVAAFADTVAAGRAVTQITGALRPAALELMDRVALGAVEARLAMGLDPGWGALLLGRSDAAGAAGAAEVDRMRTACESCGAVYVASTDDEDEGEQLMAARRMAIPAVEQLGTVMIEDVCVPLGAVAGLLAGIEEVSARHETPIAVIGHAGDGNFHPLVVFDPADAPARRRAAAAFGAVMDLGLRLGGTVTGEHGVGSLKRPWLRRQLGDDVLELHRSIKAALDPRGILNPGRAF